MNKMKQQKKKGPIRFEAIVPITAVFGLIAAYVILFLDSHLRWAIEATGTYLNGAEVNVESLHTSFTGLSLEIGRIQVTNSSKPTHNLFEVGSIRIDFLWDGVLRAKAVSEEGSINEIAVDSKRETPGRVVPRDEQIAGNPLVKKLAEVTRETLGESDLARLPQIIQQLNPDDVLKNMGETETSKYLGQLESDLESQQAAWESALTEIPGQAEADAIKKKANGLGRGGANPNAIKKKISTARSLVGDAKGLVKNSTTKYTSLKDDVVGFGGKVAKIDGKMEEDQRKLEKKLKLPRVGTEDLAEKLFGGSELESFAKAKDNVEMARSYIAESSEEKDSAPPAIEPRERASGKTYQFGRPGQYPSYWFKRIAISGKAGPDSAGGNVEGALTHLAASQKLTGEPTRLQFKGDFPVQRVTGVEALITVDHRGAPSEESFKIRVGSFPVQNKFLSDADDLRLKIDEARLSQQLTGQFSGNRVQLVSAGEFRNASYTVEGNSAWLRDNVRGVVTQLPKLTYRVTASGTWDDLKFSFQSNLASGLSRAIQAQVAGKLNQARTKIQSELQSKVGAKRQAIESKYSSAKDSVLQRGGGRVAEAKSALNAAESKVSQLEKDLKKKAAAPAKKKLKKARKKLKF